MQVLKQNTKIAIVAITLVLIIILSFFVVQYPFKPSSKPAPTASPTPTQFQTPSPTPTLRSTPKSSPIQTLQPILTPVPTPNNIELYPGEITQYQGTTLSPIVAVYQNAIAGIQHINQATYSLTITGIVNKTLNYSYDQVVNNHQTYAQLGRIVCVEGWEATLLWEGISVKDLLNEAGISPQATVIIFYASDGYTTALPVDYIIQNNIIIAYKVNNVTLTPDIGWPFILVAQSQYGYKWIKWITGIEVSSTTDYLGYWESRGYPNDATIP